MEALQPRKFAAARFASLLCRSFSLCVSRRPAGACCVSLLSRCDTSATCAVALLAVLGCSCRYHHCAKRRLPLQVSSLDTINDFLFSLYLLAQTNKLLANRQENILVNQRLLSQRFIQDAKKRRSLAKSQVEQRGNGHNHLKSSGA